MNRIALAVAAVLTMLAGSATAQSPPAPSRMHGNSGDSMAACPMGVPGAEVSAASTKTGEVLTFSTTTPAQVAELRRRVHAAAEMHNKNHASGGTHEDMMGDEAMGGMMGRDHMTATAMAGDHMKDRAMMPQSHATVADVDGGACMTLTPSAANDLKQLQSAVSVRATHMKEHGCGSMAQK